MTDLRTHGRAFAHLHSIACSALLLLAGRAGAQDAIPPTEALQGAIAIKSQEAVAYVPVVTPTTRVDWAKSPIRVDGDLADWRKNRIEPVPLEGPVHATWFKGSYGGKRDLAAAVFLCRDDRNLYVALEIADDRLPVPERVEIAIAAANSPLITTWRDVGMRYGVDDVHAIFTIGKSDAVSMRWAHIQTRMDASLVANSFGSEEERREFVENQDGYGGQAKVFAKASRRLKKGKSVTAFEAAFPWPMLAPYVPVSYAPLKFNVAIHDKDDDAAAGVVGWTPGLAGTYSAAHFPVLEFFPPTGRKNPEAYAQIAQFHFVNQNIGLNFAFHNPAAEARRGSLELLVKPGASEKGALLTVPVALPPGFSQTNLAIHSEKVGLTACAFRGRLTLTNGPVLEIPVHAPILGDTITIQPLAEVQAKIDQLAANAAVLSNLYEQIVAKGLDTAYPLMFKTLHEMFIPRCQADLKAGDSERVLRNTAYLETLFETSRSYMERVLKEPAAQLKVPARTAPETLVIKEGYYHADNKPVFLWGPCTFWWMRADQRYAWNLGFNSVGPEVPVHQTNAWPEIRTYLDAFRRNGMLVNASIGSANFDAFKKEHPDAANLDANNFMPVLVQHPKVREEIARRFQADIGFFRDQPAVRTYWLWNEPAYVNYSETTRRDFIGQYLKPRYKTVEALNTRWRGAYKSFEEVELVKSLDPANSAPWVDFQRFRNDLLVDFFGFLHKTARGIDPSRPTHTKYMCISLGFLDIERLQGLGEIAGHDGNPSDRDIIFLDFSKSLYPDLPPANTEIHIWYRDKVFVELVAWRLALHGLADGNWWCWHANARFSNTVGSSESMHGLAVSGLDLRRLFDPYMVALNRKPKAVATLFPDIVPGRSEKSLDRLRYELGAAQYSLGLQPFYATETRAAQGELAGHKLLLATESDFVRETTYRAVLDYVKAGGTAIVARGGFARNEYGDPRDAGELVRPEEGELFAEGARIYPVGQGKAICLDAVTNAPPAPAKDENAPPPPPPPSRTTILRRVLAKALADGGLEDPIRLVAADPADVTPDTLAGLDWRCAEADGAYVLCVLPSDYWSGTTTWTAKLATARPVKKIVNLITQTEIAPEAFKIEAGPNLFRIELEK